VNDVDLGQFLDGFLGVHLAELLAVGRQLHAHPELSGEEHATTELVRKRLEIAGLEPRTLTRGTGLLCERWGA
jgi:amidohydrolase